MTDDDKLRAVTIGELKPYSAKVVIEDYNPLWPTWFADDRALILSACPTALSVEHTGSTSVPGLPAKPIIDILLQVPDSADETSYVPQLEAVGLTLRIREPEEMEHRVLYRRGAPHDVNVHVYSPVHAASEIARVLGFRDWLRTHDDDRDRYAATKRELSKKDWKFVQNYADAKTAIIEEIIAKTL